MKNFTWRKQLVKTNSQPIDPEQPIITSFDPTQLLFMGHTNFVRKDASSLIPLYTNNIFFHYCEDIYLNNLTNAQIEEKMTIQIDEPFETSTPLYRTPIGVSNLKVGKYSVGSQADKPLSYNIYYDDESIHYQSGNDFDTVCFYYIGKTDEDIMDGYFEFQNIVETSLANAYKYSPEQQENTACNIGHNLNTYYGMFEKANSSTDMRHHFRIGTNERLCDNQNTLNKIELEMTNPGVPTTDFNVYSHVFTLETMTPFYYLLPEVQDRTTFLGYKSWYGTEPGQWNKNYNWLTNFPVIMYKKWPVVSHDSSPITKYFFNMLMIAVLPGFNATRRKIFE